jgi:dTDP-4-dehydrorhamnose 3,5-epimerase
MNFAETKLKGAFVIDIERREDQRGFFARAWCQKEFDAHGLVSHFVQANVGFSYRKGTIRGMHFQKHPYQEVKLVRCTMGRIYDVIVDLRPDSQTYRKWIGVELTAENHKMLCIPEGCAHGYQTMVDNTEVVYDTSKVYSPQHSSGVLFNDPVFGIAWPLPVEIISEADKNWPQQVG